MKTITLNSKPLVLSRQNVFGLTLCATIIFALSDLAFSVRTYHDIVMFVILLLLFIYNIIRDIHENKIKLLKQVQQALHSAKWLYIALIIYYVYDLITMIYTKSYAHALKKLPYMLEYTTIFLAGIYYCTTKKRLFGVMISIAATGTIVSISTYIYYFLSLKPIYFQRLSTARDYNVYACLIFVSFVFLTNLLIHYSRLSFKKRFILFTIFSMINIPTFYFAGSRRIFIMLPYLFAFTVLYEGLRLIILKINKKSSLSHTLSFFGICVIIYFSCVALLPTFSQYGATKEASYKAHIAASIQNEGVGNGNGEVDKSNSWYEKTIENIMETIGDKSMYSKRTLIYSVAFSELQTYSPIEFIFGRGAAYDIHMYDVTQDANLLDAYSISEDNPRSFGWLSAHNFLLADILNGGIIKVVLGIFFVIQLIRHIIILIKRNSRSGIMIIIPFALVLVNNFISGAYGMLNDVFFQIMMIILCSMLYLKRKEEINAEE